MTDGRQDVEGVYQWLVAEPILHEPVLVVMLTGWIDAAGAAAAAADAFSKECETSPLVTFDDDTFIDYRARRPIMELRDGVNTDLVWSTIELRSGPVHVGTRRARVDRPGTGHVVATLRQRPSRTSRSNSASPR